MKKYRLYGWLIIMMIALPVDLPAQPKFDLIEKALNKPDALAKPWVFWYWMHGAVSRQGITADLEAMKSVGIGGAYLMPIKDTSAAIPFQPVVRQLTPEWWEMVRFSMQEAKRLNLQLAMHVSDGFALAGGPWITPELSMQKLVWTKTYLGNGCKGTIKLKRPETVRDYYKDIAVFAYPASSTAAFRDKQMVPVVTTSNGATADFLAIEDTSNKQSFKSDSTCWIQYEYPEAFTCRSVRIHTGGNNYQAQRLILQTSADGKIFTTVSRLVAPRHGWQDTDEDYTHAIAPVNARFFRFVYSKEGTEPGAEDLDAAKWKPSFKIMGIYLGDEPVINQFEAKNGSVWRIAANTTSTQVKNADAVPLNSIIDLSSKMAGDGTLNWSPPEGNWVIVRIGHTSTGHTNETAGAAKGLECDKFNAAAIKLQFDNWFAKAFEKTDTKLANEVLKVFHIDSWECGSQNWSDNFPNEFKKRRGYDLRPYLLLMTGVPVTDAATSERILLDVRKTIADLVSDIFYVTLKELAHAKGCIMSAESVAPTMVSDGLLHYKHADWPMGEFWLNSPTHDKPNDMLDAISGAHIYGKNIIPAESFTSVRMNWAEHPGSLKLVGDRNFALGINKMVLHVFTHNPWMDRKPGMTLDGVGLYFQRDQTWFKQSKVWIDYLTRCQSLLQLGKPIVDIAVFTGEEIPGRSVLPDRLISTIPGLIGPSRVASEKKRLENIGQPQRQIPDGVTHSANMADPEDWIDPLNGYAYDSFNPDALMMMSVKDGRVQLPGGASYKVLVIPGVTKMNPNAILSAAVIKKLSQLLQDGATIMLSNEYLQSITLDERRMYEGELIRQLTIPSGKKGKLLMAPYLDSTFNNIGLKRDVEIQSPGHPIAWTHRKLGDADIYFISNQSGKALFRTPVTFRVTGKIPEYVSFDGNAIREYPRWQTNNGRTTLAVEMDSGESIFVIFRKKANRTESLGSNRVAISSSQLSFTAPWKIEFDKKYGGPGIVTTTLPFTTWNNDADERIKYYSGTAVYRNTFHITEADKDKRVRLYIDSIYNIATLYINGIERRVLWMAGPYSIDISSFVRKGVNTIELEVTNTWHNRLIGDSFLPEEKRITRTTAPFRLKNKPLQPAGLAGRVQITVSSRK